MSEMPKNYDPRSTEPDIYKLWLDNNAFHADPAAGGESYSIVIPPPNVTAALHLGHALNNTLQDILTRQKRMAGRNTLWMPGTDHAGIATQTVVEKRILAEEGLRRTDFTRDKFVARVQAWKDEYEARILVQLKAMGCSCDWGRTRFTMDEVCARAVRAAFFKLFADGLIYRGKRLVNWDPASQTVLADDEVEHETVQGNFWYLQYRLVEAVRIGEQTIDHVTVATTRPETMLGDTAVAMNPADPRAKYLVGRKVRLPIVGREIPIIADEHVVLPNPDSDDPKAKFSTGFLKVTPAHDPDDYAIRERHNAAHPDSPIDIINVMAPDGSISDKHGWTDWGQVSVDNPELQNLIGMDRFEARDAIVEFFRQEGLLEDVRPYAHEVGHSYRTHVPIEPYLSDQWFVAVKKPISDFGFRISDSVATETRDGVTYLAGTDVPVNSLAGLALAPLLDGRLRFVPDRYANNYRTWLENLRDWPISRQLWWGHRIPVWSRRMSRREWGQMRGWENMIGNAAALCVRAVSEDGTVFTVAGVSDAYEQAVQLRDRMSADEPLLWYVCPADPDAQVTWVEPHPGLSLEEALRHGVERDESWISNLTRGASSASPTGSAIYATWLEQNGFTRDPDVLDTWFSSALWPISTMGWPEPADDMKGLLETYYPTSVLCTAREIITLWVSRMVMFGQYFRGDIPFHDVYIHAMIQDGDGRKMSKSLGNGIDPLDIISSHGADAMRFTLAYMTTETQDVRMPVEKLTLPDGREANTSPKFDLGRNFCNKLWNAARFAMMNIEGAPAWSEIDPTAHVADAWILSRLNSAVRDVTAALDAYRFHEAAGAMYRYMWNDFCDWYVEIAKSRINAGQAGPKAILAYALDVLLRLLHPVLPFVTERIWQELAQVAPARGPARVAAVSTASGGTAFQAVRSERAQVGKPVPPNTGGTPVIRAEPLLARAAWPVADESRIDPALERRFEALQQLISGVREVRSQHGVPPSQKVRLTAIAAGDDARLVADHQDLFASLAGVEAVTVAPAGVAGGRGPQTQYTAFGVPTDATVVSGAIRLLVHDVIDVPAEKARLAKRRDTLLKGIKSAEGKLGNAGFLAKAPPDVVAREQQRLAEMKDELSSVEKSLAALG